MDVLMNEEQVTVCLDAETQTAHINFNGRVAVDAFMKGIQTLYDQAIIYPELKLLVDFSRMVEVSAESRVWFEDDFLPEYGQKMFFRIDRMAVVTPTSGMIGKMISEKFKELCLASSRGLVYREYKTLKGAMGELGVASEIKDSGTFSLSSILPQSLRLKLT